MASAITMQLCKLLVLLVVGGAMAANAVNQKFAVEPENVAATIGTKVVLPCRVTGKQGVLQWTKDDFGLGTHRNLTAFDRYTMVGIEDDGDHNLRIDNLQLEDDAKYQCQVSPGSQGNLLHYMRFTLRVHILGESESIEFKRCELLSAMLMQHYHRNKFAKNRTKMEYNNNKKTVERKKKNKRTLNICSRK